MVTAVLFHSDFHELFVQKNTFWKKKIYIQVSIVQIADQFDSVCRVQPLLGVVNDDFLQNFQDSLGSIELWGSHFKADGVTEGIPHSGPAKQLVTIL